MAINEATLIEAAISVGLVDSEKVQSLRLEAKRERLGMVEAVTRAYRFPDAALYQALADVRNIPFLRQDELKVDPEMLALLPQKLVQSRPMLPVRRESDGVWLLVQSDPDDSMSRERAERSAGVDFIPALTAPAALQAALLSCSSFKAAATAVIEPIELLDSIMKEAYLRRASDIHLEPREAAMVIRLRVDGVLQEFSQPMSHSDEEALINRIKVLANLDIAEQRMTQDGAMKYEMINWNLGEMDIRVATIPARWGERCTLRILGEQTGQLTLDQLGMSPAMRTRFQQAIESPYGMILVTGPTGSGKSTTLYAAIQEIDLDKNNVLTVEDPVEQTLDGITQVQVSSKVDFAAALRSFLRHDPDVILVGEMRDRETVEIGLRAAMTGHLMLSTLHTNDSVSAITRLADIGAERFLIGSTLVGVLAQRLGRRLCTECRVKRAATDEEKQWLGVSNQPEVEVYDPSGCSFCLGSGFSGRIGFFEALWMQENLRIAVAEGAGERQIRELATDWTRLWEDCCEKVLNGQVSLSEVIQYRPQGEA